MFLFSIPPYHLDKYSLKDVAPFILCRRNCVPLYCFDPQLGYLDIPPILVGIGFRPRQFSECPPKRRHYESVTGVSDNLPARQYAQLTPAF
jgi:hypothetical protein